MRPIRVLPVLILFSGCGFIPSPDETTKRVTPTNPPIVVDLTVFCREYDSNPIAADAKYKGKLVELDMRKPKMAKSANGDNILKQWWNFPHGDHHPNIVAVINPSKLQPFAKLPADSWIVIRGVVDGMETDRKAYREFAIRLSDCELVKVKQESK